MNTFSRTALATVICCVLAACGGGDGGSGTASAAPPSPTPAPTAAPAAPPPTPTPAATPAPTPANPNLLRVAYIGGSITESAYLPDPAKGYAGLTTAWLRTKYPQVEARNLGFGGTGSEEAAYRVTHELAGFVPDLVFLEFAVNDAGWLRPELTAHIDAVLWKLRQINPQVKVVYLSATDVGEEADRRAGKRAAFIEDAAFAAQYEDLGYIDMAAPLWAKVIAGAAPSTFLADPVHPTEVGHQIYFEAIRDALSASLPLATQPRVTTTKLIAASKLDTARFEKGNTAKGCRPGTLNLKLMDAALTCDEGETFTYTFTGTTIGLVKAEVKDGGRLACTIDNADATTADFYSEANRTYERAATIFLYRKLVPGEHTLSCRVTSDVITLPSGTSSGHKVTIGYFMVSDERTVTL